MRGGVEKPGMTVRGFTLVEISVVLVIIGLLTGGLLVARDMIKSAVTRAQITQINQYNIAVDNFDQKFGAVPGDMTGTKASQFGFTVGTFCNLGATGNRDGNGLIDGTSAGALNQGVGETGMFWTDLSSPVAGNLIDGSFPNGGASYPGCAPLPGNLSTTPGSLYIGDYFPSAKIGPGVWVFVYTYNGSNWFNVEGASLINSTGGFSAQGSFNTLQAYSIDTKIDDGLPTTGAVQTVILASAALYFFAPPMSQTNDTSTSCFNTTNNKYSIGSISNYGNTPANCVLSFRFNQQQ